MRNHPGFKELCEAKEVGTLALCFARRLFRRSKPGSIFAKMIGFLVVCLLLAYTFQKNLPKWKSSLIALMLLGLEPSKASGIFTGEPRQSGWSGFQVECCSTTKCKPC